MMIQGGQQILTPGKWMQFIKNDHNGCTLGGVEAA
jgi:hypothetical protein